MDSKLVREWKARYEAVNVAMLEDSRKKTPRERLQALQAHLRRLHQMGKLSDLEPDWDEHLRWAQVQELYLERKSKSR